MVFSISAMSHYIVENTFFGRLWLRVLLQTCRRGMGQGRVHFCYTWNGKGQNSVRPRFCQTSNLWRSVSTQKGHSAALPPIFEIICSVSPHFFDSGLCPCCYYFSKFRGCPTSSRLWYSPQTPKAFPVLHKKRFLSKPNRSFRNRKVISSMG